MKILKFYMLKEFIPPYVGSTAFFTMLLLLERVMSFVGLVARGYATVIDLIVLVFFSIPPTMALTMPMSSIMGALISVGRLSNDSEITAMRSSGIRLGSIFFSLYLIGVVIGGASFYLTDRLVPIGNIKFRTLYQKLTIARPDVQIKVHSINKISANYTLLVDIVDEKTGDLLDVTIFESKADKYVKTITARKGWFLSEDSSEDYITLRLFDGTVADPQDKTGEQFNSTLFERLDLNIPLISQELKNIVKKPRDMSMKELREGLEKEGKGTRMHNVYLLEYNKKIAIPFACVLFVFLGTPFAVTRGRSGKGLGLGIGVLIIFFYYLALLTLERRGASGSIHPALAIWLPNIFFFIVGTVNLIKRGRS
jgi:LPS export ABC transporter permease LptF